MSINSNYIQLQLLQNKLYFFLFFFTIEHKFMTIIPSIFCSTSAGFIFSEKNITLVHKTFMFFFFIKICSLNFIQFLPLKYAQISSFSIIEYTRIKQNLCQIFYPFLTIQIFSMNSKQKLKIPVLHKWPVCSTFGCV